MPAQWTQVQRRRVNSDNGWDSYCLRIDGGRRAVGRHSYVKLGQDSSQWLKSPASSQAGILGKINAQRRVRLEGELERLADKSPRIINHSQKHPHGGWEHVAKHPH